MPASGFSTSDGSRFLSALAFTSFVEISKLLISQSDDLTGEANSNTAYKLRRGPGQSLSHRSQLQIMFKNISTARAIN
jgi:hypothetical protein